MGKAMIAHLPGRNYGTPRDEQVLIATHTDAMSLIEENGGLGLARHHVVPQPAPAIVASALTLTFYFRLPPFHAGGEASWPEYDYYTIHPDKLKSIVATIGVEHMGGRQTVEDRRRRQPVRVLRRAAGRWSVITSLMDVHNNNIWLVEAIARAATDNHWPRVDVKAGNVGPGVNGGFQGTVKSPHEQGTRLQASGRWPRR
jgi:hypothetical protein